MFEWMGESYNPGSPGSIRLGGRPRMNRSKGTVFFRFCLSLVIMGGVYYLVFTRLSPLNLKNAAITTGIVVVYCTIGYFFHSAPDRSNMGWAGGFIDNPLRYSDDINRSLLFIKVLLIPGRFISESIADIFRPVQSA